MECLFQKSLIWGYSDRVSWGELDHFFKMINFIFQVNNAVLFPCRWFARTKERLMREDGPKKNEEAANKVLAKELTLRRAAEI